ncbi:O-sialoglycoprotein endopeptidase [Sporomusa acidovorans]|uniref:N(6)-L-threonylcarbamoyladenine synthase n=1 Tax=Sporomusa acidovorans (strain ATCC 49682 / DSM 3132 / Mol) TaxID=1123286 RepID=A0ABZ3J464_SPOA4|nr:O-sialoglycoprotein endopeptidase [Sporomusa acidovorans]OZC20366.1 tRNA N6-adenosine threonylcarbamoyltransferase [Sporomusa acidovorans DSM 3132]SDD36458.1 N6-L-threonylcarbamoyladenine synthase [Sporomusa acidovorans]
MNYVLGIDTSCYTTSVAILDENARIVADCRKILAVKPGKRGLQQSEMVFQHTRNLPDLFAQAYHEIGKTVRFKAIGVSAFPRPLPNSYMPAFLVGEGYAKVLALSHDSPLYRISHQENHILAGIRSAGGPLASRFLAVHLSGGTTEIVQVSRNNAVDDPRRMAIDILGGTLDIHAGQLVDRIGVLLGLKFPAGPQLESLAALAHGQIINIPVTVRDSSVSFAGPETYVRKLVAQGAEPATIAAGVQQCIARAVAAMIKQAHSHTGLTDVLLVGGVTANQFIRKYLTYQLEEIGCLKLYFPEPPYSPDNATGAAYFVCA